MSVCYLVKVAPGVKLMGFNVEKPHREGQRRDVTCPEWFIICWE